MELKDLRRMTLPKLRDFAKQETDLTGVIGMEKEALIEAIAKAKGISYDVPPKDTSAIHSIKHDIRELHKQKAEMASTKDRTKLKRVQAKIRKLKRLTRHLAREAKQAKPAAVAAPAQTPPPAA